MNKFIPNNFKYRKIRKKIRKNINKKSNYNVLLPKNSYGLKSIDGGLISSTVLEAARRTIVRKMKKEGKLVININPYLSLTSKSIGIRMGKGAGNIES